MAVDGTWNVTYKHPAGHQELVVEMKTDANSISGKVVNNARGITTPIVEGKLDGNHVWFRAPLTTPIEIDITVEGDVDGDSFSGTITVVGMGGHPFVGTRA